MGGDAVQLIGGKAPALNAGDPRPLASRFGRLGEIAVIDLDAALGTGSNADVIRDLLPLARCRVGGGIRSVDAAIGWLDAGAEKVILGTAATPETLSQLPPERTIVALDSFDGEVVTHGWTRGTGARVEDRLAELRDLTSGFLLTFVEREGQMLGADAATMQRYLEEAGETRITFAGGIRSAAEVGEIHALGADAQVGMALYTDEFSLADAVGATLHSDRPDGFWPTVVANERGQALGLAYSNLASLDANDSDRRGALLVTEPRRTVAQGSELGVDPAGSSPSTPTATTTRFALRSRRPGAGSATCPRPPASATSPGLPSSSGDCRIAWSMLRLGATPAGCSTTRRFSLRRPPRRPKS